jgi:RND family efflux transporter MFP subunit
MMTRTIRFGILAALSATTVTAAACGGRSNAEAAPAENPAVTVPPENVVAIDSVTLRSGPSISGDLTAERSATIRAEVGGSVTSVRVEEGQPVKAGQVLGTLDESVIAEQVRSAKSALTSAENAAIVARREAERTKRLLAGGAVAERDVELADRALWAAEAQLESARAAAAAAEKQWQKTRLTAPFSGVVSRRQVSVGDVMTVGNEMFTVVDPRSMQLEASVPVSALGTIKVGSTVDFDVSGYEGQRFQGTVKRVSPAVDPGTRQVRIVVNIPNAGSLVAGLFAKGRVVTEERKTVAVPITAVDLRGATPTARRIKDGKVEMVAVQLGLRDEVGALIEVTGGLARGDTVLTGGAMSVAAGTPVLVRKE